MERQYSDASSAPNLGTRRLFVVQVVLVCLGTILVLIGLLVESMLGEDRSFGFFWFAFITGCLGGSIRLFISRSSIGLRSDGQIGVAQDASWSTILMPVFFGGLMAGIAYMLFMSGILSGDDGGGLLRTNLFPDFKSNLSPGKLPSISSYLSTRPCTVQDVGKLIMWCFLAGYSEGFILGVLGQLERFTGNDDPRR